MEIKPPIYIEDDEDILMFQLFQVKEFILQSASENDLLDILSLVSQRININFYE